MTKKLKFITIFSATAMFIVSLCISVFSTINKAKAEVWEDVSYQTEYNLGDTIELLSRKVSIGENDYDTFVSLAYPDGTVVYAKTATLDQSGNYEIKYTANIDGVPYFDLINFSVKYNTINFGEKSSITYGKDELATTKKGLLVRLQENDVLEFNTIIDINKLTPSDAIVNFFATPDLAGVTDFGLIYFRLTDIENSENYMQISITQSFEGADFPHSYVKAGGNEQIMEGWEHGKAALHKGGDGGTAVYHNFASCTYGYAPVKADNWTISLFYNAETKTVYVNDLMVIDLDSTEYYTDLWAGFTSNKVRLSVWAEDYRGSNTANFCLSQVYGIELGEEIISDKTFDVNKPVITIDNDYTIMPIAKTNNSYYIPQATAMDDFCGKVSVDTKVYYNYYSNNPVSINIVDNKIEPKYAGLYTIVYQAMDNSGNVAIETLNFNSYTQIEELSIAVNDYEENAKCGECITIPQPTLSGGSGNRVCDIKVYFNGEPIELSDNGFVPTTAGKYTVSYVATDYIESNAEFSYDIEVVANPNYLFNSTPIYPKLLISGSSYEFPAYYVDDYTTGSHTAHKTNIVITDKNGSTTIESGSRFTPEVDNSGDMVKIKYVYGDYSSQEISIPTIFSKILDGSRMKLHMENYLYGSGFTTIPEESGITVKATENGTNKWTFANALLWRNFNFDIESIVGASNFDKIILYMTDYNDDSNSIKVEIENHSSYSTIIIGNESITSSFGFSATAKEHALALKYQDNGFMVGSYKAIVTNTILGEEFNGFKSNKIWLSVELVGAEENSAYKLINIAGQPMSDISRDRVAPMITYTGEHGGLAKLGDLFNIPKIIIASDVLDPNVKLTLTVKKNGAVLSDVNGKRLQDVDPYGDYTIKLEEYGQYTFFYTAEDELTGNESPYNYSINVVDEEKPVIKLSKNFVTTAKVGDIVAFPEFTVSDNVSKAENIIITKFVLISSGRLITVKDNAFMVTSEGVYEFQIYAYDEAGNMAYYYAKVTVTK